MNRSLGIDSARDAVANTSPGHVKFHSNTSPRKSRLWRALYLFILIGGVFKTFTGKRQVAAPPVSPPQKGILMSATALVPETNGTKTTKREMLDALVKQDRTVEVSTDDTLDQARNLKPSEFKEVFEKKVNGVSGFKTPMPRQAVGESRAK